MSERTTIVTGAAGFIGSNFVRHLLATTGDHVVAVDKLTYAGNRESLADVLKDARFTFVQADIGDAAAMRELLRAHRPAAVVNFAAETHVDRSIDGPRAFVMTNLLGTFELLDVSPSAACACWTGRRGRQDHRRSRGRRGLREPDRRLRPPAPAPGPAALRHYLLTCTQSPDDTRATASFGCHTRCCCGLEETSRTKPAGVRVSWRAHHRL